MAQQKSPEELAFEVEYIEMTLDLRGKGLSDSEIAGVVLKDMIRVAPQYGVLAFSTGPFVSSIDNSYQYRVNPRSELLEYLTDIVAGVK